jgi:hypothetical protein
MDDDNKILAEKKLNPNKVSDGIFTKPAYLFALTILSIFFSEAIVMVFLSYLSLTSLLIGSLLDATILSIIIFPMLFLLVLRPMRNYLDQKTMIEKEREKLIIELQDALAEIKTLRGLIPICTWCFKIRDEAGNWKKIEWYIEEHSEAKFTHGICPNCAEKEFPEHFS